MFLVRPLEEFPGLVEQYSEYCEENNIHNMDSNFSHFRTFFHSHHITIRVEGQGGQFLAEAIDYKADPGNQLRNLFDDRRQAEYDAVYLGFQLLNEHGN